MTTLPPFPTTSATGATDRHPSRGWLSVGLVLAVVAIVVWTTLTVHQQFNNSVQFSQQTRSFTGHVQALRITMPSGRVTVVGNADARTRVTALTVTTESMRPQDVEHLRNGVLTLGSACRPGWYDNCTVQYTVHVPPGTAVTVTVGTGTVTVADAGDVHVTAGNGNIGVTRAAAVRARSTTGSVSVTDATGPVQVTASDGNVNLVGIAGALSVSAHTGGISASGVTSPTATVVATNGNVRVDFSATPHQVTITTATGSIAVTLPAGGGPYQLVSSATTGHTIDRVATDPTSTTLIHVRTANGDITVGYRA